MRNKKVFFIITAFIIILFITGYIYFNTSGKTMLETMENPPGVLIDDDALYKWLSSEKDYTYYKSNDAILPTSEETERAHDNFMRVRFNKIAVSVLNEDGKLPENASFPDSSIIVKEIYSDKNKPAELLAVMVKLKGAQNSAVDWLWAEYSLSGDVEYAVTKKGKVCVSCHKTGNDYVRLFDIHK
ncbi:MAG: cytochrome P460 family protein [Chlorobi bacterium]|nr:cytochrome P460 family protein [Chlorobiota bacterium]MCI0716070.1 cytochrome P460 family protein [Chlorobiota bacterium]